MTIAYASHLFSIVQVLRTEGVHYKLEKTPTIECDFNGEKLNYSFCYLTTANAVYVECLLHDTMRGFDFVGTAKVGLDFNPATYNPWHPPYRK